MSGKRVEQEELRVKACRVREGTDRFVDGQEGRAPCCKRTQARLHGTGGF